MRKLPDKYLKIYKEFYLDYSHKNNIFRKLAFFFEERFHLLTYKNYPNPQSILELGAGNLNHVKYEKNFKYYDVIEPKEFLINASDSFERDKVTNIYSDIGELPENKIYEKIISIGVLEHIEELDYVLEKISYKLTPQGKFLVTIPAEGELLWWLGWRLTTGIGFWLKHKLDYGVIMRYEHVNTASKIIRSLNKYFKIDFIKSFPLNIRNFRLLIYISMSKKDIFKIT